MAFPCELTVLSKSVECVPHQSTNGSRKQSEGGETLIKALITICYARGLLEAGNIRLQMGHGGG